MIAGGCSGSLYVWETSSGRLLRVWDAHYKAVSAVRFTRDDALLVSGGQDGIVNVWNMASILDTDSNVDYAALAPMMVWTEHTLAVSDIHCGYGGTQALVFTVSLDATCKVWDLPSGRLAYTVTCPSPLSCVTVDNAESRLLMGGDDGNVYEVLLSVTATTALPKWCSATIVRERSAPSDGSNLTLFQGDGAATTTIALFADGQCLVCGYDDGSLRIWDVQSRQVLRVVQVFHGHPVSDMLICPQPPTFRREKQQVQLIAPFKKYAFDGYDSQLHPPPAHGRCAYVVLP